MSAWLREGQDVERAGYSFKLYPPPGVSEEREVTKRIRDEVMPNFCPLWLTRTWKFPTGRTFSTVHVVIARMEIHPPKGARIVKGLPLGPNGEKYRVLDIANGLTPDENANGFIGRYVPLQEVFEEVKVGMANILAEKDYQDMAIELEETNRQLDEQAAIEKKAAISDMQARIRDNRIQIGNATGSAVTSFVSSVSSKLSSLRKAAGGALKRRSPKNHATMPRGSRKSPAGTAESLA